MSPPYSSEQVYIVRFISPNPNNGISGILSLIFFLLQIMDRKNSRYSTKIANPKYVHEIVFLDPYMYQYIGLFNVNTQYIGAQKIIL